MKNRLISTALASCPMAICACLPVPAYPPEPEVVVYPPYDSGTDSEPGCDLSVPVDCRLACESLAKIGCPESAPSGDRSCGCVCVHAQAARIPMKTICVANASTPDQARACNVRCAGL